MKDSPDQATKRHDSGMSDDFGLTGIEFIEFATFGRKSASSLQEALEKLGFQVAARHRSKDVVLLRQGDINLILNSEPHSFARSFATRYGTSVCAIALRVRTADRIHNAAVHAKVQDYSGRIGPDESFIPAIRAVSGSLLYLVETDGSETIYDRDFQAPEQVMPFKGNLTRVDHVSQSVFPGMTRKWVRFYRRLLGFHVLERNTIVDPNGRALSTVLSNKERAVHFIINEPNNFGTDCDRFLRENTGEGVQHLAFETPDLFAYLDHIRGLGVDVLKIPDLYYDNMLAEGYDPSLVEKLRDYRVMLDTENGGQFLHAYSQSFNGGIFFEFVQRNNHQGFGRHDVTARLMAQKGNVESSEKTDKPAEMPTDMLEFSVDADTVLLGTVFSQMTHVLMPEMMNRSLSLHGLNVVWLPFVVEPDGLKRFVDGFRTLGNLAGFSVAAPHKAEIVPLLDELTERAIAVGAVNLVRKEADGRLVGDIVDGEGFVRGIEELRGTVNDASIWLVGASIEGRAIAFAFAEYGASSIAISDADENSAGDLVSDLLRAYPAIKVSYGQPVDMKAVQIAVNATPLGREPEDPMPFNPADLPPETWIADVVARPDMTRLLFEATRLGHKTCSGRLLLEKQIDEFAVFFGFTEGSSV